MWIKRKQLEEIIDTKIKQRDIADVVHTIKNDPNFLTDCIQSLLSCKLSRYSIPSMFNIRNEFIELIENLTREVIKNIDQDFIDVLKSKYNDDYVTSICKQELIKVFGEEYAKIAEKQSYKIAKELYSR